MSIFNDSDLATLKAFGAGASAPAAAAPSGAASAPAGTSDFASQVDKVFGSLKLPSSVAVAIGSTPQNAIDQSPLSIADRALLGWERTPEEQLKQLKGHFDDAQLVNNGAGAHLVVKKGSNWYQADPDFQWNLSGKGAIAGAAAGFVGGSFPGAIAGGAVGAVAPSVADKKNMDNLPGATASFLGQYGLRSLAAGGGAVVGGALGGPVGAVIGAGIGAAGAEGIDLASRKLFSDPNTPGAVPYKDPEAVYNQLGLSALFGMSQEVGGKVAGKVIGKAADSFGNVLNLASDNPQSRLALRKVMALLPNGQNDMTVNSMLQNPDRTKGFLNLATKDLENPTGMSRIDSVQDGTMDQMQQVLQGLKNKQGVEFAQLRQTPAVKNATVDASSSIGDAVKFLQQEGYLKLQVGSSGGTPKLVINETRSLGEGDRPALTKIIDSLRGSNQMGYDKARFFTQDLGNIMDSGTASNQVFKALADLKSGVHNDIIGSIGDEAGQKYAAVLNKYSEAMDTLSQFNKLTDGAQKKFTFMKKIMSDTPNAGQAAMQSMIQAGVPEDLFHTMIQSQGARNMAGLFSKPGGKVAGLIPHALLPNGGKVQLGTAQVIQGVRGLTADTAKSIPYMDNVLQNLKSMPADVRSSLLTNPQAIDGMQNVVGAGVAGEGQAKDTLLKQMGLGQ